MSLEKIENVLARELEERKQIGSYRGQETVITGVTRAQGSQGPRYFIQGFGDREFLRMNSNSYLGMAFRKEVVAAAEKAEREFGVGPGAARIISGTFGPHVELEKRLARFHRREAGIIFSAAYAAVMGILPPLISQDTAVISDELNHNCIINATRLARPSVKKIYSHNNMGELESCLKDCIGAGKRAIIVTDGIFSMRGDYAPLPQIADLAGKYDRYFEEGILTIVDDSHGVGAIGETGRGVMEFTRENRIDILVSTMGKALGVNGGYAVSGARVVEYLRETAPFYVYSNPITPSEASAALAALKILDSDAGRKMLRYLREMTAYFRQGLVNSGYEVIPGEHPIVPLLVRDTGKTREMVKYLREHGILASGLAYPIVPRGDEEIRFQVCTDHTRDDLDYVLKVLDEFKRMN